MMGIYLSLCQSVDSLGAHISMVPINRTVLCCPCSESQGLFQS